MTAWEYLFWISCFLVFYNYAGYAVIVFLLNSFKKNNADRENTSYLPTVSFIVAAFNEEGFIEQKIINSTRQDYPPEKIEFIFITDGSTDRTPEIVQSNPAIILLHSIQRKGKSAAINRAVLTARNNILIFSDANTFLNKDATKNIAKHYRDSAIGGVAGEKKIITAGKDVSQTGTTEGAYWKYESFLKKLDASFYSVVGAAGELFSLRKELFDPIADNVILDDFVLSLKVAQKGFRIAYEPDAYAMELPSFSLKEEQKRKIRIAAGGFQAIKMLWPLLLFWKQPRLSFLYISHRVLRWTLSPLCLVIIFVSNIVISVKIGGAFYNTCLTLQVIFYALALAGSFSGPKIKGFKIPRLCSYFVFMNISVFLGFVRFLRGKQPAKWEKARRSEPVFIPEKE